MNEVDFSADDWRSTVSASDMRVEYRRVFAFLPKKAGSELIWLRYYYKKYVDILGHVDFVKNLTEEEYSIIKLRGVD